VVCGVVWAPRSEPHVFTLCFGFDQCSRLFRFLSSHRQPSTTATKYLGPCATVMHSPLLGLHTYMFPPTERRQAWVFCTMGLSGFVMPLPRSVAPDQADEVKHLLRAEVRTPFVFFPSCCGVKHLLGAEVRTPFVSFPSCCASPCRGTHSVCFVSFSALCAPIFTKLVSCSCMLSHRLCLGK
jgi:hypothetical protein